MHFKVSTTTWRPFCLGVNVLNRAALTLFSHLYTSNCVFFSHLFSMSPSCDNMPMAPLQLYVQIPVPGSPTPSTSIWPPTWWRHQMETFSALLALCARNSPVPGEFPAHRSVTRSFDVFFDLRLNKRLSKQSWGWWFETQSGSLWRHCNADTTAPFY